MPPDRARKALDGVENGKKSSSVVLSALEEIESDDDRVKLHRWVAASPIPIDIRRRKDLERTVADGGWVGSVFRFKH